MGIALWILGGLHILGGLAGIVAANGVMHEILGMVAVGFGISFLAFGSILRQLSWSNQRIRKLDDATAEHRKMQQH